MAAREIYDFKTDSRRFKTCLKEAEDHFETNGYHLTIICLFFPANMNLWKRQTMVSLIPDSRSVPNLCLWLALALKSAGGGSEGHLGCWGREIACIIRLSSDSSNWKLEPSKDFGQAFYYDIHSVQAYFLGTFSPQTKHIYLSWRNLVLFRKIPLH